MSKNDGGAAFPHPNPEYSQSYGVNRPFGGMSLRDWFAGQAIAGMFAVCDADENNWPDHTNLAANAYRYADAMLAERSKP